MIKIFNEYKFFIGTLILLSALILTLFYNALKPNEKLPIYQPAMVNYELVDSSLQHIKKYHTGQKRVEYIFNILNGANWQTSLE